eukprot:jgi/Botrbrau1/23071/Bobra.0243s0012.1
MSLEDAVCVVTGANSGIGKEVAAGLRAHGAHVIMACRDIGRCEAAMAELDERRLPGSAECRQVDVGDFQSVRRFAVDLRKQLQRKGRSIRVLVNNAGIMGQPLDSDGSDPDIRVNHYGPFLLTCLLLPLLDARARIVNVASRLHKLGSLEVQDGNVVGLPSGWIQRYARSKLCNVVFTAELQRRLRRAGSSVTAYSVHPGFVNTPLVRVPQAGFLSRLLQVVIKRIALTPTQGAESTLYAATSPKLEGRHVLYLAPRFPFIWVGAIVEGLPNPLARSPALATGLWEASERVVGLTPSERGIL